MRDFNIQHFTILPCQENLPLARHDYEFALKVILKRRDYRSIVGLEQSRIFIDSGDDSSMTPRPRDTYQGVYILYY